MIIVCDGKKYQTHYFLGILNRYQCYSLFEITPYQKRLSEFILGIWGSQMIIGNPAFFYKNNENVIFHDISVEGEG